MIGMSNAIAYGNGRVKKDKWEKFINSFDNRKKEKVDTVKTLKRMRRLGLPIEEK